MPQFRRGLDPAETRRESVGPGRPPAVWWRSFAVTDSTPPRTSPG